VAGEQLGQVVLDVRVDLGQADAALNAFRARAEAQGRAIAQALSTGASGGGGGAGAAGGRIGGGSFQPPGGGNQEAAAAADRLASATGRATSANAGLFQSFTDVYNAAQLAAQGIQAVVGTIVGISSAIIRSAGEAQKLTASFKALTGSAEGAEKLRNQLFLLSKTTPFKNEEILESARRFLAVGVSLDKVNGTINRLGALAAQSGQSLDRIGLVYSQVYAKGRLQGEENLQFLEAGIDLTGKLQQVTGLQGETFRKAMEQGKISVADVNAAIVLATGDMVALVEGGKAVDVALENIGDNFGQVGLAASQALAPAFAAAFSIVNEAFDQLFPNLQAVQDAFKPLNDAGKAFAEELGKNPENVAALAAAFESLLDLGINAAVDALKGLTAELEKNPQGLVDAIVQTELGLRKAFLTASALAKILTVTARLQSELSKGNFAGAIAATQEQFRSGLEDYRKAAEAQPIEIKVTPVVEKAVKPDGDLDDKIQKQIDAIDSIADVQTRLTKATQEQKAFVVDSTEYEAAGQKVEALQKKLNELEARGVTRLKVLVDTQEIQKINQARLQQQEAANRELSTINRVSAVYSDRTRTMQQQSALAARITQEAERERQIREATNRKAAADLALQQEGQRQFAAGTFDGPKLGQLQAEAAAAGEALELAGAKVAQDIVKGAAEAADRLRQATEGLTSARLGAFDLIPDSSQQQVRQALTAQIQSAVAAGEIDLAKLAQRFPNAATAVQGNFDTQLRLNTDGLSIQELQQVAGQSKALTDATQQLGIAMRENQAAVKELSTVIAGNRSLTISVPQGAAVAGTGVGADVRYAG